MGTQLITRAFGVIDISEVQNKLDSIEQLESKLKAQQLELEKARELIKLMEDNMIYIEPDDDELSIKVNEFLKKKGE